MFRSEAGVAPPALALIGQYQTSGVKTNKQTNDQLYSTRRMFLTCGDEDSNDLLSATNSACTLGGVAASYIGADASLEKLTLPHLLWP